MCFAWTRWGQSRPGAIRETQPIKTAPAPGRPAGRARQEIAYGRRGKGCIFGAFEPKSGQAFALPHPRRATAHWVNFLGQVDQWVGPEPECVFVIVDNLSAHRAADVLLFSLAHPRWHFLFQPTYAAYLNPIEPWWKILRSLALKGRRFESWTEIEHAVEAATAY